MATQNSTDFGTLTATLGEEHVLATVTESNNLVMYVDLNAMGLGDEVIIRAKTKVLTGGTSRILWQGRYHNTQSIPIVATIPILNLFETIFTLQHIAGTFTISGDNGTLLEGQSVTGDSSGATGIIKSLNPEVTPTTCTIRVTSGVTEFVTTERAEFDVTNYITLNDVTPDLGFPWSIVEPS